MKGRELFEIVNNAGGVLSTFNDGSFAFAHFGTEQSIENFAAHIRFVALREAMAICKRRAASADRFEDKINAMGCAMDILNAADELVDGINLSAGISSKNEKK